MKNLNLNKQNNPIQKKSFKDKFLSFFCKPFKTQKAKNTNLKIGLISLLSIGCIGCFFAHWVVGLLYVVSVFVTVITLLSPVDIQNKEVSKNEKK